MSWRNILLGLLAGLAAFSVAGAGRAAIGVWGQVPKPLPDGQAFLDRWAPRLPRSGLYRYPPLPGRRESARLGGRAGPSRLERLARGPVVGLLVFFKEGRDPRAVAPYLLLLGFHLLAGLVAALLLQSWGAARGHFLARLLVVASLGAFAALMGPLQQETWWGFPLSRRLFDGALVLVSWTLAGIILARFVRPRQKVLT